MNFFLRVDFPQRSLHSSVLVNEIINEVSSVFILESSLINSCLLEESLQVWINIVKIKSMVGIPSYVTDVLEVGG